MAQRRESILDDRRAMRLIVAIIAALWVVMPLLLVGSPAEDAIPLVVAGEMATEHPDQIYPTEGLIDVPPRFREAACEALGADARCAERREITAFLSTPAILPLSTLLALAGPDPGALVIRLIGASAAALALAFAWRDLADRGGRSAAFVAGGALALTPIVGYSVGLGQTSPLLFLAAAAGVPGRGARGWVATAAWALVTFLKAFPIVAVVALRRYATRAVAAALAVGAVATAVGLAIAGMSRLGDFHEAASEVASDARAGQRSGGLESAVDVIANGDVLINASAWGLRIVLLGLLLRGARREDDGVRWSIALLAAVVVVPQVWAHYLIVVPAVGVALARSRGAHVFLAACLATVPAAMAVAWTSGTALTLAVAGTLVAASLSVGTTALSARRPAVAVR